jgi:hypothetical protein
MNSLNIFVAKVKFFSSTYKWLLFPLVPIIIFICIIFYLFSAQKNQPASTVNQPTSAPVSGSPSQAETSPEKSVSPSSGETDTSPDQVLQSSIETEAHTIATGGLKFAQNENDNTEYPGDDEVDEGSIKTTPLPDGSTEYEYASDDPYRPHVQIIKDSSVVFRRNLMPDMSLSDYSNFFTNPEYTSQGSTYYGNTATIYADPSQGIAIVANSQTGDVYEQYLFPAMTVSQYVQKFGKDISTFNPAP